MCKLGARLVSCCPNSPLREENLGVSGAWSCDFDAVRLDHSTGGVADSRRRRPDARIGQDSDETQERNAGELDGSRPDSVASDQAFMAGWPNRGCSHHIQLDREEQSSEELMTAQQVKIPCLSAHT
ncbi:MAG: hypothetical protein JWN34_5066 [Bryobacterales bacterium]|nr:hypothetical protein [Bryobacterales bacterium]